MRRELALLARFMLGGAKGILPRLLAADDPAPTSTPLSLPFVSPSSLTDGNPGEAAIAATKARAEVEPLSLDGQTSHTKQCTLLADALFR
jgi:hypothetical protein